MSKQLKCGNFIKKLQALLQNQEISQIICWDQTKTTIDILDIARLETQIIPVFFRHKKFQSFVRQLNLYGFKKIKVQGRQRFTHTLLLKGQGLSSITSAKSIKLSKENTSKSEDQGENIETQKHRNEVNINSLSHSPQILKEGINTLISKAQSINPFLINQAMLNPYIYYPSMMNYLNFCTIYSNSGYQNFNSIQTQKQQISGEQLMPTQNN